MAEHKYCAGCKTKLSRYNTMFLCGACSKTGAQALIPADIWWQPQIRAALNSYDFGKLSVLLRQQTSLTQREIAEMVGLDQSGLSRLEKGKQRITHYEVFFRFVQGLGIPPELVLPPEWNTHRKEDDSAERRAFRAEAAGTTPVLATMEDSEAKHAESVVRFGIPETHAFRETLYDLCGLDDQLGGDRLWRLALRQLLIVENAVDNGSFDRQIESELQNITGDIKRSVGWYSFDSGRKQQARSYLSEALNLASLHDDHLLFARTIINMTRQAIDLNRGRETVHLVQRGINKVGKHLSPRFLALFAIREAQGHALQGDKKSCLAAIGRAHEEFLQGVSEQDPEWLPSYICEAELISQEGMCHFYLSQYARANGILERSAQLLPANGLRRNLGICMIRLSTNSLFMGEFELAASQAKRAATLSTELKSTRVTSELKQLGRLLVPHYKKTPAIRDVLEHLEANKFSDKA